MRGKLYDKEIKRVVEKWRARGKSYSEITRRFGVPKSTLSFWLNKKYAGVYQDRRLEHLAKARPLALAAIQKRIEQERLEIRNKVAAELQTYPLGNVGLQKAVLASLYWAEGSKHGRIAGLKFANTDHQLLKLFLTLLRNCFHPDEEKFRVGLHLHYYHSIKQCKIFWSRQLGIPVSQFWKPYIKKRSVTKRYRKNFKGICFLYHSNSRIRKEMLELASQLLPYM
ncbi:MAG: hypothetical protein AAB891_00370 [Patescibacteria group bacterium]